MKIKNLIVVCLLSACTPLVQSSVNSGSNTKILRNIDYAYEDEVKTIIIRPTFDDPQSYLLPAVTQLGQWNLMLEFDDL